jgi:alpha-L-fucosidase
MIPQFKDVVERYQPAVIFSDGEWEHPSATWRSTEILEWLFNESPVGDDVVVNDRWGEKTRHKHGGYYTTEYGSGLPDAQNPWEECRGMAHSFGYSRTENLDDYNSAQELVYMFIDIVSRGGNFLLDIGPTADGRIPVIMQERLLQIGDWLGVNGEAIYGSSTWTRDCQWSDGKIPQTERGEYKSGFDIMKLVFEPDPGFARKEILFTRKGSALYAICPVFPDGGLVIKDLALPADATVSMLGVPGELKWDQTGADIRIAIPRLNPSRMPCDYAYTLKIDGI